MPSKNKITDYIDQQASPALVPVQGYVPSELRAAVAEQMKKDKAAGKKITWDLLLEASLRSYLLERGQDV